MTKNDEQGAPREGKNDSQPEAVEDTGSPTLAEAVTSPGDYKLTAVKEEDVTHGLVELEVVADGTFKASNGEVLRTGDRKVVSSETAKTLLDVKVNGKTAFKQV